MLKEAVAKHQLEEKVTISASFCLGQCSSEGVSIKIDDEIVTGVSPENLEEMFQKRILEQLK